MTFASKIALPLIVLAAPASAHTGAHLHPHGSENILMGLAFIAVAALGATLALRK
ncbi:MAG: hypothetical protein ACRBBO_12970 [Cognatishimia sp.]|uniref:hypothetical protein n=1 Tax=Cognatishimia sp. 1_MG-2023 TaxID=3062642 RepID=UPI0026E15439|nr:hypothetical protein [Cognatishimia sp. 1_MG-2023]MDO6726799.1 hypothetical protein [Cognatishimia sp. 1_MG-2023]